MDINKIGKTIKEIDRKLLLLEGTRKVVDRKLIIDNILFEDMKELKELLGIIKN